MFRTVLVLSASLACAAVIACSNHENPPPQPVTTTGAGVTANEDAVIRLTDATCSRSVACNDVGPGKKYADHEACTRETKHDLQSKLRAGECPRGVKSEKLSDCLQEIQNQKCGNVIDGITASTTCRKGNLCID